MKMKQISLTMPEEMHIEMKKYAENSGYRNLQEYLLELLREVKRYKEIEYKTKNKKSMTQKEAIERLRKL